VDEPDDRRVQEWLAELEARHFADLTFPEVSRALRALSSAYVERRATLGSGTALSGAGKRAAFALFYAPLHFLLMRHIVRELPHATKIAGPLVDLGCGTGASSAAWATLCGHAPEIIATDRHPWAAEEAKRTYRAFGLRARVRMDDLERAPIPSGSTVLLAFTVNELAPDQRQRLLTRLAGHAEQGGRVLVVEPLARFVAPWWSEWQAVIETAGGRADEWRLRAPLPPLVQKLDRAAGLNHREITGRSLALVR